MKYTRTNTYEQTVGPQLPQTTRRSESRHPLIHVIIAVEEIHGEAVGIEREFDRYDVLQHASSPLWTEKLRRRLARQLGDDIWYVFILTVVVESASNAVFSVCCQGVEIGN